MAMERENRAPRGRKRRKVCAFCVDKVECIDYKDAAKLRRYTSPPHHRHLRHASASADRGHQARPSGRPAALRHRLIALLQASPSWERLFLLLSQSGHKKF